MMALRRIGFPEEGPDKILGHAGLSPIWDETESIAAGVSLDKKADIRVVAECLGEKGAAQLEETAAAGAIVLRNILRDVRSARLRQVADNLGARSVPEPEFVQLLHDAADKALSNVKVERQETLVTAQASVDLKGRIGALAAVLPTAEAMRANSRKVQAANNIKQIMLAMHNYADVHKHFPPAVIYGKDGKGKAPHSWRVELLPYLEGETLYKAYNFDEPWDSENNRKILAQMPVVFRNPGDDPKWVRSAYYVMVGKATDEKEPRAKPGDGGGAGAAGPGGAPGRAAAGGAAPPAGGAPPPGVGEGVTVDTSLPTAFSKKEGIQFTEILDGTSNTIAVVEAKRDIPWTKPEDIPYDPEGKAPKLGGFYEGGFWAGICDGSVQFLPADISPESLRAYLSPAAGDQIAPQKPPLPARPMGNEVDGTPLPKARSR
jgi:hypothetical protein